MSEDDLEGYVRPRAEIKKTLWEKTKTVAPWLDMAPKEILNEALRTWLDKNLPIEVNGDTVVEKRGETS